MGQFPLNTQIFSLLGQAVRQQQQGGRVTHHGKRIVIPSVIAKGLSRVPASSHPHANRHARPAHQIVRPCLLGCSHHQSYQNLSSGTCFRQKGSFLSGCLVLQAGSSPEVQAVLLGRFGVC